MQDPIIVNPTPQRPPRRTYSKEFKIDAVSQCQRGDRSLAQVAMDLKINANLLRRWQKEQQDQSPGATLLPVHVTSSASPSHDATYIEFSVAGVTIKVIGNIDSHRIAELVRALQ